jgi:hypothetical protein
MPRRKKRGPGYWPGVFDDWAASGLSQRRFCEARGIAFSTFCYWRRRLRETPEVESSSPFIPVEIKPPIRSSRSSHYEVRLECGARIRVPFDFEKESLARLIGLLEGDRC